MKKHLIASGILAALCGASVAGEIYRCTIGNRIIFQDEPCRLMKTTKVVSFDSPAPAPVATPDQKSVTPTQGFLAGYIVSEDKPAKPSAIPPQKLYYIPDGSPVSIEAAEDAITRGVATWNNACNVNLVYGGLKKATDTLDGKPIRWNKELIKMDNHGLGAVATGGPGGVDLNPANGAGLQRIVLHELGHFIGIGHLHEDTAAVMSYLNGPEAWGNTTLSASDIASCNLAMKNRFGGTYTPPAGKPATMGDKEAAAIVKAARGA